MTPREELAQIVDDVMAVRLWTPSDMTRAILAADWVKLPEGSVMVPREPTEAILQAGAKCWPPPHGTTIIFLSPMWRAMLAAAPKETDNG